jgi:hypothetical protein
VLDRLVDCRDLEAAAVRIAGQRYVAKLREPLSALLRVITEPERLGHHENSRALAGSPLVEREKSAQGHVAVAVLDSDCSYLAAALAALASALLAPRAEPVLGQ